MNPNVDIYLSTVPRWQDELTLLRQIVLDCGLTEELKWRAPCYTYKQSNVIIIQGFKEYCALMFFKGALLSDAEGIMVKPGESTHAGRQIRFSAVREIVAQEASLKAYIYEAVEVEKAGLKVDFKERAELVAPPELQQKLDELPDLKTAFEALTPGRQNAYFFHFSTPKQSKTRVARVEKYIPRILSGKGLTDCLCGLSRKMPGCDGSHKQLRHDDEVD